MKFGNENALRAYLELVRVHLAFTAPADSLAGFFIARAAAGGGATGAADLPRLLALGAASVLVYSGGMVTNDLFDLEKDRARHPRRPLPSGAVRPREARILAAILLLMAILLGIWLEAPALLALLIAAVLAYNGGLKMIPVLGDLAMGSCRTLNFLLGAAAALPAEGNLLRFPSVAAAAGLLGLYIALVTAISRLEDRPYSRRPLAAGLLLLLAAPAALAAWGWRHPGAWLNALVLALIIARALRLPGPGTVPAGGPHPAEGAVRAGLSGIFFVNAGILWSRNLAGPALALYGLWFLGRVSKTLRRFA